MRHEYEREMRARGNEDPRAVLEEVLRRPLERGFYVGADTVLVMDRRRRSGRFSRRGKLRAAMWADLLGQVDELLAREVGLTRVDAVCRVLATGTSNHGFCLGAESAGKIIRN